MECVGARMVFSTLLPVLPAYIQSHMEKGISMAWVVSHTGLPEYS